MIVTCAACSKANRFPAARMGDKAKCGSCRGALLPIAHPVPLASAAEFDELVQQSQLPVLVDYWAEWCGPCRMVAPELEKLAAQRLGKLVIAKVDTEALPDVARRFGISSIPTMILFRNGKEAERLSGAMPASAIAARLGI
jgi:thioredoxin 2